MIDGVGKSGPGRIDLNRSPVAAGAAAARSGPASSRPPAAAGGAVADIVAAGAPVDTARVMAIRTAIMEGRYPVDPDKIAARMIELDLPARA